MSAFMQVTAILAPLLCLFVPIMAWKQFVNRSMEQLRNESAKILRAAPLGESNEALPMLRLTTRADLEQVIVGSDADMGGKSRAALELDEKGKGKFHGVLNPFVAPGMKLSGINVDRSGYAGMRTKAKSTLFGLQTWDTAQYSFLRVRLRSPPVGTKASTLRYFVNIQTDGPIQTDLYQHRLWPSLPGEWEDVLIPFTDFTLTNSGELSEKELPMMREKVRTVGISVMLPFNLPPAAQKLQGNEVEVQSKGLEATDEGHPFDLGLELIEATNVVEPTGTLPTP